MTDFSKYKGHISLKEVKETEPLNEISEEEFEDIFKPNAEQYYKRKLKSLYDKLPAEVFIDLIAQEDIDLEGISTRQYIS